MTEEELLQIISIDQLNMSNFFSDTGKKFDAELRKSGIKNEIKKGAVFFLLKEDEKVIGYMEYMEKENKKVTIKSVQIHPSEKNILMLRKFINGIYSMFKGSFEEYDIISAAHKTNQKSILLHKKLGFTEVAAGKDILTYECKGFHFMDKLGKYIKKQSF